MNFPKLRARPWGTALLFFAVGVLFASAMDWTPFSHAQGSSGSRPVVQNGKSLEETSNAFVSIAEHVTPSVVAIQTRINAHALPPGQRIDPRTIPPEFRGMIPPGGMSQIPAQEGTGSGFIISSDGYIVTNNHVVTAQDRLTPADKITVKMTDHKEYEATLVGHDPQTDVAVLKIDAKNLPTVALGDDERLRIGEWVLAIGNPLGLDFTVTAGIVSAKGRNNNEVQVNRGLNTAITDFIQTDAAINPGNSGGPLVNIRGEVIGINTAIASNTGFYAGYGFAIPVDLARTVWQDLIDHGHIVRAQLGVSIREVTPEDAQEAGVKDVTGVFVAECNNAAGPSPACSAGVQAGDVILSLDGKSVDRVSALQRIVRAKQPGDNVAVKLMRYGKPYDYRIRLTEMQKDSVVVASAGGKGAPKRDTNVGARIGLTLEPVTDDFVRIATLPDRYKGLRVADVSQDGPVTKVGPNDVIVATMPNHEPIKSEADLKRILAGKKAGDVISLEIIRPTEDDKGVVQKLSVIVNLRVGA